MDTREPLEFWKARSTWAALASAAAVIWLFIDPTATEQAESLKSEGVDAWTGAVASGLALWAYVESRFFSKKKMVFKKPRL